jgi:hypothetical protein
VLTHVALSADRQVHGILDRAFCGRLLEGWHNTSLVHVYSAQRSEMTLDHGFGFGVNCAHIALISAAWTMGSGVEFVH